MLLALIALPAALAVLSAYAFFAKFEGNVKVRGAAVVLTGTAGRPRVTDPITGTHPIIGTTCN